ncbi:MAG: hypothetical protein IJ571_09845 [Ruminococcus sp.]|nr:hypothetical protein [Ruminococcus sp.]
MTKKLIPIAVLAAGMLFCSCGKIENSSSKKGHINIPAVSLFDSSSVPDDDSSVPVPPDTEPETEKFFSADDEELSITDEEAYGGKVYNGSAFLIRSSSGYISEFESNANFIIETQQSLDSFCEKYNIEIDSSEFFNSIDSENPLDADSDIPSINGYHVVVSFSDYSFDGSHPKAGGFLIKDDKIRFVCTAASLSKVKYEGAETLPAVMDGYLFIAAVPVSEFRSFSYPGWEYLADADTEPEPQTEPKPEPKPNQDEIVILYRYQNLAWGVQDSGAFIDASGAVYQFDFANGESYDYEPLSGDELINAFKNIQQNEKPLHYVDKDTIQKVSELIPYVNKDAERVEKFVACDAGQHTFYIVEGAELTELWSTGDYDRELIDPAAEKIHDLVENS